jgi:acyl carrier protein
MEDLLYQLAYKVGQYYGKKINVVNRTSAKGIDKAATSFLGDEIVSKVKSHANVVSAAGLADAIPYGASIAIGAVITSTWKMYYDINQILGISFSENFLKSVATGIVSNLVSNGAQLAAHGAASALSWIPGVGTVISAGAGVVANRTAVYAAATTYLKILSSVAESGGNLSESSFNSVISSSKKTNKNCRTRQIITEILVDKLGVDEAEVKDNASFMNDLGADSLDAVEVMMEIEKKFGISIPDDEAEEITTVGEAIAYVERHT